MKWYKDSPDEGDYVVVSITDIDKNSAYADLEEYEGQRGLIHISEVARSWIQDVTKELSEGEKTVAQVIEIGDGSINLSLKRVNEKQKKDAMARWNKEKKASTFLEQLADELDMSTDEIYEEVGFKLQEEFGTSFTGFEISVGEEERLLEMFDEKTVEAIQEVARENINLKQEKFEGEIRLEFEQGDGVRRIREAFEDLGDAVEAKYVSAPKYAITAWGRNPELAKKRMDEAVDSIREKAEELEGTFEFSKA
ncbi:S1 RNA-binding domain-containing protein [Candidatus Nanohalococcus occultus]|uniref:S1 RNA-binding domain-containing protein n=1 Tax=Candidatus Nanohalococcus occultus TaxID=2978047 RepID=UPI0039E0D4A0